MLKEQTGIRQPMLILERETGERVRLRFGTVDVWVEVQQIRRRPRADKVFLKFLAPREVEITREELLAKGNSNESPKAE